MSVGVVDSIEQLVEDVSQKQLHVQPQISSIVVKSHQPFQPDKIVQSSPSNSLLETLEQAGVDVAYQCREGYCGACRLTLKKGVVAYTQEPMASFQASEVLACCCHPTTNIEVEI